MKKENDTLFIRELSRGLGFEEGVKWSQIFPEGVGSKLKGLPDELVTVIENVVLSSKIKDSFEFMKQLGNEDSLAVGISRNPEPKEEEGKQELWITWVVVASADKKTAVLEFAFPGEDTATYVFNVENSYEEFLYVLTGF